MGGGMVFGEPYSYGFHYPYEVSGTPGYNSVFPPRRYSSFGGDESYPEEVTNLARKRKLDGIKGEAPGVSDENSVREILVKDPSVSRISSAHESQAQGNASTSRGNNPTPPASPSARGVSVSSGVNDGHTVAIPVVFSSGAAKEQSVPVVTSEGIKKPRRTCSEEVAAVLIQSTYRGYAIRRTNPLEHMRRINSIKTKLEGIEQQLSDADIVQQIRTDLKIRVRITEGIMALLLQLDSIQGVHPDVRVWRKAVTKDVVTLQEKVDALLKDEVLQVESVCVESSVQGHDKDIAMEGGNIAEDDSREHDEVMNEVTHEELLPESQNTSDNSAEDIVLDQLKLEDEEVVSKETAVVEKLRDNVDHVDEVTTSVSGLNSERRLNSTEATGQQEFGDAAISDGVAFEESEDRWQLTESSYQGADGNEGADSVININADQPINHDCEDVTETTGEREGELRSEACLNMGVAENASDRKTGAAAVQMNSNEPPDVLVAITVAEGEQGMEVDSERTGPHDQGEVLLGKSEEFHCSLKNSPREQEKMKVFLKEISSPEKMSPVACCIRLNGAEEMDCLGAPGTCSDFEGNDGDVASLDSHLRNGSGNADEGGATAGRTEQYEHDHLVLKLSEENKMLKSLLLEVMKWNQLQANSMKNVNDRLRKLEDKLMKEKSGRKPKVQRCTRSRLERRLRRYRE